jgi:ectoine hydroxylase-related dioxygenase (phytanoyl-CoA dioxygenase family)
MPGYLAALEVVFPLSDLSAKSEDFYVVPGTQQQANPPNRRYMEWAEVPIECPAGGMIVVDSTLWHREGLRRANDPGIFVAHQFTKSFIKPHFDHVRALGDECLRALPERTRQLLGWHTRIPSTLDEFYLPPEQRLYRDGQG